MRKARLTIRKAPKPPGLQRLKRGSIAKAKQPPPRHPREEKRAVSFLWAVSIPITVRSIRSTATFLLGVLLRRVRMFRSRSNRNGGDSVMEVKNVFISHV